MSVPDEVFSSVPVEAQAAGLPVICTNAGALPESVQDGIGGTVVPTGNVKSLTDAIQNLLSHPEKHEILARVAREPVRQNFSWDSAADKLLILYAEARRE